MTSSDTEKPIHILHDVDTFEGQGIWVTQILPLPQLLGYIDESEDPTSTF